MPRIDKLNGKPIYDCTAEELKAEAERRREAREESWRRSDTDGFLSQWANDLSAQLYERQAKIAEAGGNAAFICLRRKSDGAVVAEHIHTFPNPVAEWKTVERWKLPPEEINRVGRKWIPVGEKSRIQKKLGYYEDTIMVPAVAAIDGRGTGLSGQAWVGVFRRDDPTLEEARR